jgi:hypothetical protein
MSPANTHQTAFFKVNTSLVLRTLVTVPGSAPERKPYRRKHTNSDEHSHEFRSTFRIGPTFAGRKPRIGRAFGNLDTPAGTLASA